jgi:plastocyanin domain-containing protein
MSTADIIVLVAAGVGGLGWFFFGPRRARSAQLTDGVQRVEVAVRGGYRPAVVKVRRNVPLELVFEPHPPAGRGCGEVVRRVPGYGEPADPRCRGAGVERRAAR